MNNSNPYKPYTPQYRELGIDPVKFPVHKLPAQGNPPPMRQSQSAERVPFAAAFSNKRREAQSALSSPVSRNVPYAEAVPVLKQTAAVPNVGNNIETTWTSLNDFSTYEDFTSVDARHPMVDNNDFIQEEAYGFGVPAIDPNQPSRPPLRIENAPVQQADQTMPLVNEYVLLVRGEILAMGVKEAIQNEVEALMYGERPSANGSAIDPKDIVVMKRIPINVGVFLAE